MNRFAFKVCALFVFFVFSSQASALVEDQKLVNRIYVASDGSSSFSLVSSPNTASPNCYLGLLSFGKNFVPDTVVYQAWLSGLLAAQKAAKQVQVSYTATANAKGDVSCVVNQIGFY